MTPETDETDPPVGDGGRDAKALRHALRTPLNHIIGYSELLIEQAMERELVDMAADLGKIRRAGQGLLESIESVFGADAGYPAVLSESTRSQTSPSTASTNASPAAALAPGAAASLPSGSGRLLVVDDDENNREIVTRLVEGVGYEVSTAENGAQALEKMETGKFDLVLLDVMMPVMDGIEACARIKNSPDTRLHPVIIMTALDQVEDRVRGILAGADDFLTKPVHRDELLARIQTSLKLKYAVDERFERLKCAQEFLGRFVPEWVTREIEGNAALPELEKVNRDMSAMFVDVSGYTRLSERMGQTADFVIEKYFSRYLDTIRHFGGDITETSGDGLMAVFPAGDAAQHARSSVLAALHILATTDELNAQLAGIFEPIAVHIGVNSGIAAIGPTRYEGASGTRWTYTALGPVINLAARIAEVAQGGMVCIGMETARRIGDQFESLDLGMHALKNVSGEVAIHHVLREKATPGTK